MHVCKPRLASWCLLAGLILYAADLVLRAGQMANVTTVTAAAVDEQSGVATLVLRADEVRPPVKCLLQQQAAAVRGRRWQKFSLHSLRRPEGVQAPAD